MKDKKTQANEETNGVIAFDGDFLYIRKKYAPLVISGMGFSAGVILWTIVHLLSK